MATNSRGLARVASVLCLSGCVALGVPSLAGAAKKKSDHVVHVKHVAGQGKVLFTTKGYALYTYAKDTKGHSNCTSSCLALWPALTIPKGEKPRGVKGLGVIDRGAGVYQVTWHRWPLYTFASDAKDKVTGNGVADFHVALLTKKKSTTTTTTKGYTGYTKTTTKNSSGW